MSRKTFELAVITELNRLELTNLGIILVKVCFKIMTYDDK